MNVRTLCLAILNAGDATGYEIRKMASDGKFSHFVDASFGSIYPALRRLLSDECVTQRVEHSEGKPSRKVYTITPLGRRELLDSLCCEPAPDIYRSEFLMIAIHAPFLSRDVVKRAIAVHHDQLTRELGLISAITEDDSSTPAAEWAVNYGRICVGCQLSHLQETKDALLAIAGTQMHGDARQAAE